jgi:hypothetical protein
MHEVFLPIMIMVFTLATMLGLVLIFRGWMVERDRIIEADAKNDRRLGAPAD